MRIYDNHIKCQDLAIRTNFGPMYSCEIVSLRDYPHEVPNNKLQQ